MHNFAEIRWGSGRKSLFLRVLKLLPANFDGKWTEVMHNLTQISFGL